MISTKVKKDILVALFSLMPLFLVTIRSWSSAFLIIGSILCVLLLLIDGGNAGGKNQCMHLKNVMIFTLMAPIFSVLLSSLLRGCQFYLPDFDGPSRFILAIAVFLLLMRIGANTLSFLQYAIPLSIFITLFHQLFVLQPKLWGPHRMSTYFADPLVFGYTSITFALLSLGSINSITKDSRGVLLLKLGGSTIGFYLSIMSGSRTGWLAVPLVALFWLYQQENNDRKKINIFMLGVAMTVAFLSFLFSSNINHSFTRTLQEVLNYPWIGLAPETSVGLRITFLRIAWSIFMNHPLAGIGNSESGYEFVLLPPQIFSYASPESIRLALQSGFHNEIVTNAIRSGVVGLLATLIIFLGPLYVFIVKLKSNCQIQRAHANVGVIFMICIFVSSLSTEVFDLKYMVSFCAFMIVLLASPAIANHETN